MSKIAEFYAGRTVLITGATGFMGKVLLERMLRTLPDIKKIYLLLRPKKGLKPRERIQKMLSDIPFTFNNIPQSQFDKIFPINADLSKEGLDLSEEDCQTIIDEVSIVIHLAATVRFDLPLSVAIIQNTVGTKILLELCRKIRDIVSVVHVSTTFCNIDISNCEEKVYDVGGYVHGLIEVVKFDQCNVLQDCLIAPHPNTYTFTKRLAEIVVQEMGDKLPLSIVRPSIVAPALKEPIEGWVDNLNGPVGLLSAIGVGVLKVGLMAIDNKPDLIPVDIAINGIIAASWARTLEKTDKARIFNLTILSEKKITWRYITDILRVLSRKYPHKKILWYPRAFPTTSYTVYGIVTILLQVLPSAILDFLLVLCRRKPFLLNVQKRIYHGMKLASYFTLRKFHFVTTEAEKLFEQLSPADKNTFYGIRNVDLEEKYFTAGYFGLQKYFFRDDGISTFRYVQLNIVFVLDILFHMLAMYWTIRFTLYITGGRRLIKARNWDTTFRNWRHRLPF